ncbi:Predicted metal-dependent hydrolase, TIM-barrel fold [Burkholderia sp. YR290]|nr:Predicted metal-dependent hydrolase, TIM-barrel fold [Burkholderia sp. YR290]
MDQNEQNAFRGNRVRGKQALDDWHARVVPEAALEPEIPIVDAHHHLYGEPADIHHYRLEHLGKDLAGGHRVIGTVYIEAYFSGWRQSGPESMRPVGEVELIESLTRKPLSIGPGECQVAAGIVSHADLTLGDRVADVLEAELEAGAGRLRGVRHMSAYNEGVVGKTIVDPPKKHLLADPTFRRGIAQLERFGLSFDVWSYHYQLAELMDLAEAFPGVPMILDHVGGVIGVAEFRSRRAEVRAQWATDMRKLAKRPNVYVKVGGLGMPVFGFGFEERERPATSEELARAWHPFIDTCVDTFGPQRCLFESNFPVDRQSCGYVELWNAFKLATRGLSVDERKDLFYRSACRAYQLPDLVETGDRIGAVQE